MCVSYISNAQHFGAFYELTAGRGSEGGSIYRMGACSKMQAKVVSHQIKYILCNKSVFIKVRKEVLGCCCSDYCRNGNHET